MEFKRVFRGYDINQVERYINETADKEKKIRLAQRERIDELSDENYSLREQLNRYKADEQAIADSLVASRNFAQEVQLNAEAYADKAVLEAKKFYATWLAYAQTLVATLTSEELESFNELQRRLERVIDSYETEREDSVNDDVQAAATSAQSDVEGEDTVKTNVKQPNKSDKKKEAKPRLANPISKVEQAAEAVIDLRELIRPEESLEELCADLGLIGGKK